MVSYNNVIRAIAKLEISVAVWSTPGGGGKAIPAHININPTTVPINPNPQAKFPNNNKDDLSL